MVPVPISASAATGQVRRGGEGGGVSDDRQRETRKFAVRKTAGWLTTASARSARAVAHWITAAAKQYAQSFSFIGLVVAIVFFAASVTPSLLPRPYVVQGLLSGFSLAVGYLCGIAAVLFWKFLGLRQPSERLDRISKRITSVIVAIVFVISLARMADWQNSIRQLMQMAPVETTYPYRIGLIAIVTAIVLVALGRLFAFLCVNASRGLSHYFPPRIASTLAFVLVGLATLLLLNDVVAKRLLNVADQFFDRLDSLADAEVAMPSDDRLSGSEDSLITWDTIGRRGKAFVAGGPTKSEIGELTGRDAEVPIRVYAGLRSRPTTRGRAKLALEELVRVGGFEREVLIVATPTGTGWLDPSAVDTVEYLNDGDTAIVSIQYSYLPSWMSILVDPTRSRLAANALFDEVYGHWTTLPKDQRPRLYLHGLSLGAMGSVMSADLYTIFDDPIHGAVWSGTPFPSQPWQELIRDRNAGSPAWLPTFRDSSMVRFMNQSAHFRSDQRWGAMRNVYIQYPSDPMVWFSPSLAFERPRWLDEPRGEDVSPLLKWYPIITLLQLAFDLPMATSVPLGHGHNYAPASYIDAWLEVTAPPDWEADQTDGLKRFFESRVPPAF